MSNVRLSITPVPVAKPAGVFPAGWLKRLKNTGGTEVRPSQGGASLQAEYLNLDPGSYVFEGSRVDDNNNVLGSTAQYPFSVTGNEVAGETMLVAGGVTIEFF